MPKKERKDYEPSGIKTKKRTTTKEGKREYMRKYMQKRRAKIDVSKTLFRGIHEGQQVFGK